MRLWTLGMTRARPTPFMDTTGTAHLGCVFHFWGGWVVVAGWCVCVWLGGVGVGGRRE